MSAQTEKREVFRPRYMVCPSCGNFNLYNEKEIYCIVCGEKYIGECPKCKEIILYPTLRYCPVCGENIRKKVGENSEDLKELD